MLLLSQGQNHASLHQYQPTFLNIPLSMTKQYGKRSSAVVIRFRLGDLDMLPPQLTHPLHTAMKQHSLKFT